MDKTTIWLPGTRVMVDNTRRATITKVLNHAGDPTTLRYLVHLDAGEDYEARHDQLSWQSDYRTRTRLEEAGFESQYGGGGYFTEAFNEVVYANRSHDYAAKHPEDDTPPVRPQPTVDHILDALSLLPQCRGELDDKERELIDAARAAGATWDQVGLVLGYTVKGARQGAAQRGKKLRRP